MDMEKVIRALRNCSVQNDVGCQGCPYFEERKTYGHEWCTTSMAQDALALLTEQEAVEWINVKDRLPEKDGQYLVVYTFFNYKGMGVVRFSHNLHEVDEYIFNEENRPGWYEPDDEVGYFERTTVTHWAKLPEFPKEGW